MYQSFIKTEIQKPAVDNMNTFSILERAADLNEDGVYQLSDGRFEVAIATFEAAVSQVMQVCQEMPTSSKCIRGDCSLPSNRCCVEVPGLQDDQFYLYSCTMSFQVNPIPEGKTVAPIDLAFYAGAMCFNLGLAYHKRGQQERGQANYKVSDELYRQALHMYQYCTNVLSILHRLPIPCDDVDLMWLATLNNQAQIHHALNEEELARDCFVSLTASSFAALANPLAFSAFERSHIQEFVRNSMVFGLQPASAAPCA